jgi:hypothetical protein
MRAMKHQYWGAGEKDCPREIKAGNGELHTLRCKSCGKDNPQSELCAVDIPDELLDVHAICDQRDAFRAENARLRRALRWIAQGGNTIERSQDYVTVLEDHARQALVV